MKTSLLASIAMSLFLIDFWGTSTRLDDAFRALAEIDPDLPGDLVLATGGLIVLAAVIGIVKAVAGAVKGEKSGPTDEPS